MEITHLKKIFCAGIGGIGISGLARILKSKQIEVIGSDRSESGITHALRKEGIKIFVPESENNITKDIELLVYSAALPENHPERMRARKLEIPEMPYPEALSEIVKQAKLGITVSGTNGKTTTTAMLGRMLEEGEFDPTVLVGSIVKHWNSNVRIGHADVTLVEACEHKAHILYYQPDMTVLTNIEAEHLDFYKDIDHIQETFQKYIDHLPVHGWLVINNDDPVSMKLKKPNTQIMTYGIENDADVKATSILSFAGEQNFELWFRNVYIDDISLKIPGRFNVYNALGAAAAALAIGIEPKQIKYVLETFDGTARRFENLGQWKDATVILDYAHHPTGVEGTIQAAEDFFNNRRVVVVFQPHQKSRTKSLFDDFVTALQKAPILIVPEIFHVPGREDEDISISSNDLVQSLEDKGKKNIFFVKDLNATEEKLKEIVQPNDVILMMGAGDIYKLAEKLVDREI